MIRGRGGFRGRGGYRGGNNARADLPFNKEGRIAPYTKGRGSRKPGDQGRFKSRLVSFQIFAFFIFTWLKLLGRDCIVSFEFEFVY